VTAHYIASSGLYGWHKAGKFHELQEKFRKELATIVRLRQNRQIAQGFQTGLPLPSQMQQNCTFQIMESMAHCQRS